MNTRIKAFVFDLDGVITDSAEFHYEAWSRLASELNIPFDKEYNELLKGVSRMESLELILNRKPEVNLPTAEKEALAARKNDHYKELIQTISPEALLPGIGKLLEAIAEAGMGIALASASRNAPFIIERLGIGHYFQAIVDPAAVPQGKPHPDIYLQAAAELGVAPSECVGVEDAEAGVQAVKRAGMYAVGIGSEKVLREADYIVPDTSCLKLENILDRIEN
ncbi:beta-phosphoglucomutase [Cohnella pontilimi]|uniref:Beta-phosphoglucomutase n=1 Tax=Cohnella pontilimi TaxID=2564100 RepID=A0A4U0FD26_9BACL|nr:beta-phosphoglucomutase [Cohnella pontilimi]TJY42651.1 beta-phosphoglucomutase [Cohnella pontilimi]